MSRLTKILFGFALLSVYLLAPATDFRAEAQPSTMVGRLSDSPLWQAYKKRFVGPKGNVIDNVNGGVSHSESQGYGLLLALAANDADAFGRIYNFTKSTLAIRSDNLHAWRYRPNASRPVDDKNNASDGDVLIAWALLEAAEAGWGELYRNDGHAILTDLEAQMIERPDIGLVLAPGERGFETKTGGQVANLSYWVFPAFERLFVLTGKRHWKRLIASGEQLIEQFAVQYDGRVPDWIELPKGQLQADLASKKPPLFAYEAIRVPLYLLMGRETDKNLALAIIKASRMADGRKLQRLDIKSGASKGPFHDRGFDAIGQLAKCHESQYAIPQSTLSRLDTNYYPATLQFLAVLAAKQGYEGCLYKFD